MQTPYCTASCPAANLVKPCALLRHTGLSKISREKVRRPVGGIHENAPGLPDGGMLCGNYAYRDGYNESENWFEGSKITAPNGSGTRSCPTRRYRRRWTPSASTRIESHARLAMTIYFVAARERLAFRSLATTPTLRSATSEILYSMEVPKTEATSTS